MKNLEKSLILTIVGNFVFFVYPTCTVSETEEMRAKIKLQQVALFKNGLGFFVSEVTCPDKKDSFSFVPLAAASHGTFWVSYTPKVKLESLKVREIDSQGLLEAVTIAELLRANVGRKVKLIYDDEEIVGIVEYFAEDREEDDPDPYAPGGAQRRTVTYRRGDFTQSHLMVIETDDGEVSIDPYNVKKVEFLDGEAKKTLTSKGKLLQLDIKLQAPAGGEKLTVSYLAKGITWAPSYIVDITETDKGKISAKAVVINETCNLDDVAIQLVTGFPHLQFADVLSPLSMKENLAQFLQALTRGESERGRLGVMPQVMRQRVDYERPSEALMPAYGAAEAGKLAEDLFFYPVEKVHLAKEEVGYFPLFTESVPYKHIYQWKIPDYVNEEERYYDRRQGREEEYERVEEVWHCLRIKNATKVPWTTAPAEIVKEGLILGQDTLNYTPEQGETTLKITKAVSVKAEQCELETDRKRDAAQLYGYHYDLVTVEGKLLVTNFQPKAITLEITKSLSGEVKISQPEAKIESLARGLRRMNGVKMLTWTIELKPSETKQLDYTYEVYVRR